MSASSRTWHSRSMRSDRAANERLSMGNNVVTPAEELSRAVEPVELVQVLKELDAYGFGRVTNFLKPAVRDRLHALTEAHYARINAHGKVAYAGTPSRDKDDKILYNLQNLDRAYIDLLGTPFVRAVAMEKLNDPYYRFLPPDVPNYVLQYYNARSSGQQLDLHIDSNIPFAGQYTSMMQFVFLLEDSQPDNGCTTVVPGSHKSGRFTDRELQNVHLLTGKAGDIVFWDSRLWHGTVANTSGRSRWGLVATLSMWWVKPSMDIVRGMNDDIYRQCSDEQKQLLGFCAIPPVDPFERNNTKCGYEFLKPSVRDYGF